jgi:poly-gamma-glutamate synthesis protein (capsule biosynthesis protein)
VRIRFLAVGDINLGRSVGQQILRGDTLFPFAAIRDTLLSYDVVFGNLESCLSDQGGETQNPDNNLVFTGPPAGAATLRKGGVQIVSTANNHALDYGVKGWSETMANLGQAGVAFVGTARDSARLAGPVILERRGIRIAFFACTDLMNHPGPGWKRRVAWADTSALLPRIREARAAADLVVVSYHGGDEYADTPSASAVQFARRVADAGAALFLGHHPHVPYGIERRGGALIVHSLGNFVFRQPSRFWTKRSFALAATIVKDSLGTRIEGYSVLPVLAGACPSFAVDRADRDTIFHRIRTLSSPEVTELVP